MSSALPDAAALCRACGICCGWSLLGSVSLGPAEVDWAKAHRLPIAHSGERIFFRLPCGVLEAHGEERVCGDYGQRPRVCRAFRCKLLARYEDNAITLDDALLLVRRARAAIAAIESRLEGAPGDTDFVAKLASLGIMHSGPMVNAAEDPDLLLDLGVLHALLRRYFHDPAATSASG